MITHNDNVTIMGNNAGNYGLVCNQTHANDSPGAYFHTQYGASGGDEDGNTHFIINNAYGGQHFSSTNINGNVAIPNKLNIGSNSFNPAYDLTVTGTFYSSGSSQAYKENITDLDIDTEKLYKLRPVSYKYKTEHAHLGYVLGGGNDIGLISEEVIEIIPELAIMTHGKPTNIDYPKLTVLLLAEMQKLNDRIIKLEG